MEGRFLGRISKRRISVKIQKHNGRKPTLAATIVDFIKQSLRINKRCFIDTEALLKIKKQIDFMLPLLLP